MQEPLSTSGSAAAGVSRWLVLGLTVLASACAGPAAQGASTAGSGATASQPPSSGATADCSAAEVQELISGFVASFNAGHQTELHRLWTGQGQGFGWYSTEAPGQRLGPSARNRDTLGAYFASRHEAGERLRITSFRFNGNDASYGHFEFTLIRQTEDLAPTAYRGKGAAMCDRQPRTLGVWSMATDPDRKAGL